MQLTFCPLFSGSSGNALFVGAGDTRVLIDAGLSGRAVCEALHNVGALPETLNGILVTHEHSDHVRGVGVLSRKYRIPVFANARTWQAMERAVGDIPASCRRVFESGDGFFVGDLNVLPFPVPHDAAEPVGYRVYYRGRSVATATDMGVFTKQTLRVLSGADLVLMESNHDVAMLRRNAHYSASLKTRILSRYGHMSNEACAEALCALFKTGVHRAVLGHLSQENNTPELAMEAVCEGLAARGVSPGSDMQVDMAFRDRVGGVYVIG